MEKYKTYFEREEFIENEDLDREIKTILKSYKKPDWEPEIDGNDYIIPLSKKEMESALRSTKKKILSPHIQDCRRHF